MDQKNRAVILKTSDFNDADRLVTFFTEDFGKLKGVAKHARRSKKRFGGGFEPGSVGRISFAEKQNAELVRIDEFTVEEPAWKIAVSLERITALYIALELADKMLPLNHASRKRFGLLTRWINFIGAFEPDHGHKHAFFYKWLAASGLEPVFDRCIVCGKKECDSIDSAHGGAVCKGCARPGKNVIMIPPKTLRYLQGFKLGKITEGANRSADEIFEQLLIHAIGGELRSLKVAREINDEKRI